MRAARFAGTLISLVVMMVPSVASAQTTTSPTSGVDSARLRLFLGAPPPEILWTGPPKAIDFRNPPPTGGELPRWTVEWKALVKGPRRSSFSVGFIGQRGNPLPLSWSQGSAALTGAGLSIPGPGTYRDQAGVTFGIQSPALVIKGATVQAFADVYLPVSNYCPKDPGSRLLNSAVLRAGIKSTF